MFADVDELDKVFSGDPYPYGIEPNRKTLETLIGFLVDQGFVDEPITPDELFAPIVGWEE